MTTEARHKRGRDTTMVSHGKKRDDNKSRSANKRPRDSDAVSRGEQGEGKATGNPASQPKSARVKAEPSKPQHKAQAKATPSKPESNPPKLQPAKSELRRSRSKLTACARCHRFKRSCEYGPSGSLPCKRCIQANKADQCAFRTNKSQPACRKDGASPPLAKTATEKLVALGNRAVAIGGDLEVGAQVSVYWPGENTVFDATVVAIQMRGGDLTYTVHYTDEELGYARMKQSGKLKGMLHDAGALPSDIAEG